MKRLVIASNNKNKVREIKTILAGFYDEILSLEDAGIDISVVEDGVTFRENAGKKAKEISLIVDGDVLADDSGLCVDALNGAPGVYSARFSGEGADDAGNNARLTGLMDGVKNRKAAFVCALVLARGGEELLYVEERAEGVLIDKPRGKNGFG